jgi:dienelactone hydrolase
MIISRRQALQTAGLTLFGLDFRSPSASAVPAQSGDARDRLDALNRFPTMVHEYFVERTRAAVERSHEAKTRLRTRSEAEAYVRAVRDRIRVSFGPFPERTPLNPRVTGVVDRDSYRIEKVIFESRPQFLVSANLYIPKGRSFPVPGIVGTCGHSANGKCGETYQAFAQGLARMGYAVLIYDPISQGERAQARSRSVQWRGGGVNEHLDAGNQQFLVGEFFGSWRAWDGIRALDYLLSREEVDSRHVGVTGNSGGGTMTSWLCGLDQRWTMAAPSCFVTSFGRNMENELPADTEQCPPRALALGLDHEDFLAALAPKPILILAKERDYFDVRGTEEAHARLKHLYGLLGAEQNIAMFAGPTPHGYTQENREAMYRWFNKVTGVSKAETEPALTIEKDETLWCTPKGQVWDLDSRSVYEFTREKSQALTRIRSRLEGAALESAVRSLLRLPDLPAKPHFRILRPIQRKEYPRPNFTTYAVETEPGIRAFVYMLGDEPHLSRPPRGRGRAVLYVSHQSSDEDLRKEPLVRELLQAESGSAFYACDVRGIGESRPNTCGRDTYLQPYGNDYFYAIHSVMLDYPYVGQRCHDILSVLEWLQECGHSQVHLAAKGWGTVPAAFAALLSDRVEQVTLKNALASYASIAESPEYSWPLSSMVPAVLEHFDLPDCYRALEPKKLRLIP